MRKEHFLREIRQDACVEGSKAEVAWKAAISISDSDKKWNEVDEYYPIEAFAKAFGVELPASAKRTKKNPAERIAKKLATAKEYGAPAEVIGDLEKQLAKAKEEDNKNV